MVNLKGYLSLGGSLGGTYYLLQDVQNGGEETKRKPPSSPLTGCLFWVSGCIHTRTSEGFHDSIKTRIFHCNVTDFPFHWAVAKQPRTFRCFLVSQRPIRSAVTVVMDVKQCIQWPAASWCVPWKGHVGTSEKSKALLSFFFYRFVAFLYRVSVSRNRPRSLQM